MSTPSTILVIEDDNRVMPDVVLPAQFFAPAAPARRERALLARMLLDAVHCYQKYCDATSAHGCRLFDEAEHWLMDADDDPPFTFAAVCEFLALDADAVRASLRRWRDRHDGARVRRAA